MRRTTKGSVGRSFDVVTKKKKSARVLATQAEAVRFAKREKEGALVEGGGKRAVTRQLSFSMADSPFEHAIGYKIPVRFMDQEGLIKVQDIADWFGLSKVQLADTVGLQAETFHRATRAKAPKTQSRVKEMLEIVGRVAEWAGGKDQALAWYRAEPLPAFGGRTAEALVKEGKAAAVRDYLDHIAVGGFA